MPKTTTTFIDGEEEVEVEDPYQKVEDPYRKVEYTEAEAGYTSPEPVPVFGAVDIEEEPAWMVGLYRDDPSPLDEDDPTDHSK